MTDTQTTLPIVIAVIDDDPYLEWELASLFKALIGKAMAGYPIQIISSSDIRLQAEFGSSDPHLLTLLRAETIVNNYQPDICVIDAKFIEDGQGPQLAKELVGNSGNMSRAIILTKEYAVPFMVERNSRACSVIYKFPPNDRKLAELLSGINQAVDDESKEAIVKHHITAILTGSELPDTVVSMLKRDGGYFKKIFEEYICVYRLAQDLRLALSEVCIFRRMRMFRLPVPLRTRINNVNKSLIPYWESVSDLYPDDNPFWEHFVPMAGNHTQIIHNFLKNVLMQCDSKIEYPDTIDTEKSGILGLLKNFEACEPLLYARMVKKDDIAGYRDHFYHPFHVFLLGTVILDWVFELSSINIDDDEGSQIDQEALLIDSMENLSIVECKEKANILWNQWAIASIFHDIGYVISKSEKWIADFVEIFFGKGYTSDSRLSKILGKSQYQVDISHLSAMLGIGEVGECLNVCHKNGDRYCERAYFEAQLDAALKYDLDHGIVSALSFLSCYYGWKVTDIVDKKSGTVEKKRDIVDKKSLEEEFSQVIHLIKCQCISGTYATGDNCSDLCRKYQIQERGKHHKDVIMPACFAMAVHNNLFRHLGKVSFEKMPIVFLLKYIDICQEYGRPQDMSRIGDETKDNEDTLLLGIHLDNPDGRSTMEGGCEIPTCEVILGCMNETRWKCIESQARLIFGNLLTSKRVDFVLTVVNLTKIKPTVKDDWDSVFIRIVDGSWLMRPLAEIQASDEGNGTKYMEAITQCRTRPIVKEAFSLC